LEINIDLKAEKEIKIRNIFINNVLMKNLNVTWYRDILFEI
jgi:hypothetical protein